jgi:hypothetical protein
MRTARIVVVAVAAALAVAAGQATAQEAEIGPDDASRPWAEGVTELDQKQAMELFTRGNGLLRDALFVRAADSYREALSHWKHPAIYYNLALALINLEKPLALYEALVQSMRFGAAPLDEDKFRRAQNYKRLTEAQLAQIEIVCNEPGTQVAMDGKVLFTGPGRHEALVPVGEHSIVGTKAGYLATTLPRVFKGGDDLTIEVKMYTVEDLTRQERRWAVWQPWAVVGGGVAVAALGGLLHASAKGSYDDYDAGIAACGGCAPPDDLAGKRDRGDLLQGLAVSSYIAGGAAVAAGAVMVYLNRGRLYRVSPEELEGGVAVVPTFGPDGAGLQATVSF